VATGPRQSPEKETAAQRRPLRRHGSGARRQCRRELDLDPPDDAEDLGGDEELGLERDDPDDRAPGEPDDERDGARVDGAEAEDLPVDGALRMGEGEPTYGDPEPMARLGRDGEVRGTMTGLDELADGLAGPLPTRGDTGCRTMGDEGLRVVGAETLDGALPEGVTVVGRPLRRMSGLTRGSTNGRLELALSLAIRPGRYGLGWLRRPRSAEVEVRNGEPGSLVSTGRRVELSPPAAADDRGSLPGREATIDCADERLSSFRVEGWTRRAISASSSAGSRAMTRVMSRPVRAATPLKVRDSSSETRAADGARVVSGPVTTTPVALP
jgi:hypothetical protein